MLGKIIVQSAHAAELVESLAGQQPIILYRIAAEREALHDL
jgi:hypothetical protein